jgi:hypothetical protein
MTPMTMKKVNPCPFLTQRKDGNRVPCTHSVFQKDGSNAILDLTFSKAHNKTKINSATHTKVKRDVPL